MIEYIKKKEVHQSFIREALHFGRPSSRTLFDASVGDGVAVVFLSRTSCTYVRIISLEIISLAPILDLKTNLDLKALLR